MIIDCAPKLLKKIPNSQQSPRLTRGRLRNLAIFSMATTRCLGLMAFRFWSRSSVRTVLSSSDWQLRLFFECFEKPIKSADSARTVIFRVSASVTPPRAVTLTCKVPSSPGRGTPRKMPLRLLKSSHEGSDLEFWSLAWKVSPSVFFNSKILFSQNESNIPYLFKRGLL